jgi:hypothetical protein
MPPHMSVRPPCIFKKSPLDGFRILKNLVLAANKIKAQCHCVLPKNKMFDISIYMDQIGPTNSYWLL